MNKRIKKKLSKRYGYKKYSNPIIKEIVSVTIMPEGKKVNLRFSNILSAVMTRNNRIYSPGLISKMCKDISSRFSKTELDSFTEKHSDVSALTIKSIRDRADFEFLPRMCNGKLTSVDLCQSAYGGNNE